MSIPKKFTFTHKHVANVYEAEVRDDQCLVTWTKPYNGDCTYRLPEAEMHVKDGTWVVIEKLDTDPSFQEKCRQLGLEIDYKKFHVRQDICSGLTVNSMEGIEALVDVLYKYPRAR